MKKDPAYRNIAPAIRKQTAGCDDANAGSAIEASSLRRDGTRGRGLGRAVCEQDGEEAEPGTIVPRFNLDDILNLCGAFVYADSSPRRGRE
jgi:hypothetical protein